MQEFRAAVFDLDGTSLRIDLFTDLVQTPLQQTANEFAGLCCVDFGRSVVR